MWFPHIAIHLVFVLDIVILYFLAIRLRWYAIVCSSSSDVAIKIWSSAYSIVFTIFLLSSCIPFFITLLNSCIILLMYRVRQKCIHTLTKENSILYNRLLQIYNIFPSTQQYDICICFNITYIVFLATCFDSYDSSSGINIQELLVHIVLQFFYVLVELLQ